MNLTTDNQVTPITVVINETDLISREFDDCYDCALCCAIERKTGMAPYVTIGKARLFASIEDRTNNWSLGKLYRLEPAFPESKYDELRKLAMNHQKVFHTITLIPV